MENGRVKYAFYEKPQVGNRVILKGTALPETTVRATLLQETVRRMLNCSEDLPTTERQSILSSFASKMINSGHSVESVKITLVQGCMKYLDSLRLSKLNADHPHYRPLHLEKTFKEDERQLDKYLSKMTWFSPEGSKGDSDGREWRSKLHGIWRGAQPIQRKIKGIPYSTVMQVPSTKGSWLMNKLCRAEPKLAKITGYSVKYVEKSGVQLARLFNRVTAPTKCHWSDCSICIAGDS